MAPYSSTLAWKIPWTEEPGRLQSMGSLRVGHNWECTHNTVSYLGFYILVRKVFLTSEVLSHSHEYPILEENLLWTSFSCLFLSVTPHFYREVTNKYSFFSVSTSPPHPCTFVWLLFLFAQREVLPIKTSMLPDQPSSCLSSLSM